MQFPTLNLAKVAENEFSKLEAKVLESPAFQKVEAKMQADLLVVEGFLSKITPAEIAALFPGKFTPAEITVFETAVTDIELVIKDAPAAIAEVRKTL